MISRAKYSELRKQLKKAGFEQVYSYVGTDVSGSLYMKGKIEFFWTPKTTLQDVLNVISINIRG